MTVARSSFGAALVALAAAAAAAFCAVAAYEFSPLGVPLAVALVGYVVLAWNHPFAGLTVAFLLTPLELITLPVPSGAVSPAEGAFAVVGLCWIIGWIGGRDVPAPGLRDLPLGILAATGLAGVLVAEDAAPVWRTLTLWTLFAGAFFQAQAFTDEQLRRLLIVFGVTGGVLGAIGASAFIGGAAPTVLHGGLEVGGRATGTFLDPNYYAMVLVLAVLPAAAIMFARRRPALWLAPAVVAGVAGIALSFSRGAIIALVAGLLVIVLATRPRWLLTGFAVLALLVVVLRIDVLAGNPELEAVGHRISTLTASSTAETSRRPDIWATAADIAQAHPLVGVGIGGFATASWDRGLTELGRALENAHNLPLSVAAEQGIIALVALLVLAGQMVVRARKALRAADPAARVLALGLAAALAGFAIQGLTIVPTRVQMVGAVVMVLAGMLTGLSDRATGRVRA